MFTVKFKRYLGYIRGKSINDKENINCPFCDEEISSKAKKCKHCGEFLDPVLRSGEESKRAASSGGGSTNTSVHVEMPKRSYPWFWHLVFSCLTGVWFIGWILCYLNRNKDIYY